MLGSTRVRRRRAGKAYRPKKLPRQARAKATYESILDAAARLLTARGYGGFTTNHVAEVAGVAIGSLYEYFPDKETIVAELVRRTVRETLEEVTGGLEGALARDFASGLRSWVRVMFAAVKARRELVRAIWRDVPFLRDLDEIQSLQGSLLALAQRGRSLSTSPLVAASPEAMMYLVTVMSGHAIVESVVARPRHLPLQDVEECFQRIVATLLIAPAPGSGGTL
jgi:AcrR family transcriptional regulator